MRSLITVLALMLFPAVGFSQDEGSDDGVIADHYFITFKSSAGLIDPPDPSNKVPMDQHSSGQSKEALAQVLGLNGEILRIFDALNAIYVRMDAQEAERWRRDERVESVEPDRIITAMLPENEDGQMPHYSNESLKIPVVDTDAQPSLFQDGEFVFDATVNAWRLINFRVVPVIEGLIKNVELITTDANPVQVFLRISSPNIACNVRGKIGLRKVGNQFNVSAGFTPPPPNTVCAMGIIPFEETVQLPVFGLPVGTYEYNVNGEFFGSFELTEDNVF